MQEAAPELSTLPETWERTSLSDKGIREALRARSKHFAALDEPELADSGSMSPGRSASQGLPFSLSPMFIVTFICSTASFKASSITIVYNRFTALTCSCGAQARDQISLAVLTFTLAPAAIASNPRTRLAVVLQSSLSARPQKAP